MLDLNDLRIFEKVASLRSFSEAARSLGLPKSNISRRVSRLESELGTRLLQRTTRRVVLTSSGIALQERCAEFLGQLGDALDYVGSIDGKVHGELRVSAGAGWGINVLSECLPSFLIRYPEVSVNLQLAARPVDLLNEQIDVAIRMGPLLDSSLVSSRLGSMKRYLCASPEYLSRKGTPATVDDLEAHDIIEMPGVKGRPRVWRFTNGDSLSQVCIEPRVSVDEALTIYRLVRNGAGLGIISAYLCTPEFVSGRLVRLLPEWRAPDVDVSAVFPSRKDLSPSVRAFIEHLKVSSLPGQLWQQNMLEDSASTLS
jgi:LysR family transcriptional regulator for bpeEF and oprC